MTTIEVGPKSSRKTIGENSVLLSLLVGDEGLSRCARKMTVAGRARFHQSNQEITTRHPSLLNWLRRLFLRLWTVWSWRSLTRPEQIQVQLHPSA